MPSQFEAIAEAVKDRLAAAPAVSTSIERSRSRPVSGQATDAVVIYLRDSQAAPATIRGGRTNWQTRIEVECYAAGDDDGSADTLLLAVYARLAEDPALGLADESVYAEVESLDWSHQREKEGVTCARLTLSAQHQTSSQTIE